MFSRFTRQKSDTNFASFPAANLRRRLTFRDGKILAGLALIVVSIVAGAALLRSDDTTMTVWQANRDLSAGASVTEEDFTPVQADLSNLPGAYTSEASSGVLLRGLKTGELLPANAVTQQLVTLDQRIVILPVEPLHAPELTNGDEVDVWTTPVESGTSTLVLSGVQVVSVSSDVIGAGGESGVVVAVSSADAGKLIAAVRSGVIDVVKAPVL